MSADTAAQAPKPSLSRANQAASLLRWLPLALLLAILAGLAFTPKLLGDPDTYWHIATGQWILEHGRAPSTDPFSFTFHGAPWTAHEWLSEVVYALAYRAGGWSGVLLLASMAFVGGLAILAGYAARHLPPLGVSALILFAFFAAVPSILARPHILAFPLLAVWLTELLKARADARTPPPWLLLIMVAWANLHGSFLLGLALLGAFALEAVLVARRGNLKREILRWAVFGAGSIVAAVVTPHGPQGILFPLTFVDMQAFKVVDEWRSADFSRLTIFEILLLEGLFLTFWLGVKIPPFRIFLLLGLLHLALKHERHQAVFGLGAGALLVEPIAAALGERRRQDGQPASAVADRGRIEVAPNPVMKPVVIAAALLLVCWARLSTPHARIDDVTPAAAFGKVPKHLRSQPVFNDYDFGGFLIFEGVRPFIDSRADMYGDAFVMDHDAIMRDPERRLRPTLARWGVRWTILRPQSSAVGVLDRTSWCRRLSADAYAVVHVCNPKR